MTEIVGSPSRAELTTTQVLRLPTTLSHLTPSLERATDGQQEGAEVDASGNPILKDAGKWLRNEIKKNIRDVDMKYIDPSYIIRSIPTTSVDRIYCKILAHNAVHGAFAGFTGVTVGLVNTHYVYLPIEVVIQSARTVDPKGKRWNQLKATTGQPDFV